ncbi:MAG TPA: gamma-glutamyl-gamma-aminobutyrate hydrolase family protein [Rectinemataceae bacterium]|nr:gamma-glutamyl-gamma-aminobutyrate hydrolase family protein [Rectinemataceae bacterium]
MKPRIGLSSFIDPQTRADYVSLSEHYTRSIAASGGVPFVIPQHEDVSAAEEYIAAVDGLLLTGGKDLDPALYGQDPVAGIGAFGADRDAWELALFAAAVRKGAPIFGICRGCQLMNVALGGTLYQDLRTQRPGTNAHSPENFPVDRLYHSIEIGEGSLLHRVFGKKSLRVNSFHHQSVRELAPGLEASAFAADGVLEGFEAKDRSRFLAAVQFHPETLTLRFPEFLGLFEAFMEACRG